MSQEAFDQIEALGKNLQEAKKNKNILEGREAEIYKSLQAKYGIKTLAQLEKRIEKNEKEQADLLGKITATLADIKTKYDWE